ncbi:C2CD2 [Bugula neritina]|uniref:C2CD2 n=1 Tax=Bugula neritina TaxID=10212 RepID=A0A7J7JF55_BUGNE|nr:C2CD2 [Bugula neritina]
MCLQVLKGELQLSALQLTLTASDNSVSIHSNLLLILHLLKTEVNIILANDADSLSLTIKPGEMITRELQFSPYYQGVDCVADEKKLTHHVTEIITNIALVLKVAISPRGVVGDPPSLQSSSLRQQSTPSTSSVPPKPPRSIEDKKLMIKLIKATKLNKQNLAGMDAYCVVQVDQPYQTHSTSIAKNTVNPYWDEHFLFDMNSNTNQVTFRVYGNSKDTDDNRNCLGESVIEIEVLRYNHGIRLVLPLERRAIDMEPTHPVSGSVTIEAFFVDSAEFSSPESDDVFAQSVEPLLVVSDTGESAPEMMEELPSPTLQLPPGEDIDHRLSELEENTLGSNSSTRVGDKDGSAQSIGVIHNDSRLDSTLSIDMKNAEIITLQPQDSVTDLVMKEISNRHDMPSTIIITSGQGRVSLHILYSREPRAPTCLKVVVIRSGVIRFYYFIIW